MTKVCNQKESLILKERYRFISAEAVGIVEYCNFLKIWWIRKLSKPIKSTSLPGDTKTSIEEETVLGAEQV